MHDSRQAMPMTATCAGVSYLVFHVQIGWKLPIFLPWWGKRSTQPRGVLLDCLALYTTHKNTPSLLGLTSLKLTAPSVLFRFLKMLL